MNLIGSFGSFTCKISVVIPSFDRGMCVRTCANYLDLRLAYACAHPMIKTPRRIFGILALADPGGGRCRRTSPNRINFFCFRICFHRKVYVSEVGAPPNGSAPPQQEILDPPLISLGALPRLTSQIFSSENITDYS